MRIIFLGTSSFALPCLRVLVESENTVLCVVSRPPRPAGRGKKLRQPPVAEYSKKNCLEIFQPEKLTGSFIDTLKSMEPELIVSAAYGAWLPKRLLEASRFGVVNVHPSLLPQYRGAAPIARAILDGREETGVSFMLTDSGWDTGPVIAVIHERILPSDTTGSLQKRLSMKAADNIIDVIEGYSSGKLIPETQPEEALYADKITTDETWLDWNRSASSLERKVRAFQPSPGARTMYSGKLLKISGARVSQCNAESGEIVLKAGLLHVGCGGEESLEILEIQPASRSVMSTAEFIRGARMKTGDKFERT
ncbi:MAG: methionyl-tRNA formyltransferase [Candidatus Aegiribacteria sp.]|nr:methionyl-tRNA formyltransferase [Candidatus Aegiribacteria sp.]